MLIGISCGFVITLFNLKILWWLSIILGAAFFNTGVSALGLWQRRAALDEMEKVLDAADYFDEGLDKLTPMWADEK